MKKYISLIMVMAVALLFISQNETIAKTAQQANVELSKVNDGETYDKTKAPMNYKAASKSNDEEANTPRFKKWFVAEIEALAERIDRFWHKIWIPAQHRYFKTIEVVE